MATRICLPSSSGGEKLLIKTATTNGTFTKYFDISKFKKLFWSFDFTNAEDACTIQVALVDEQNRETNLFNGNLNGGQVYKISDIGNNKRLKLHKTSARYSNVSFCCVASEDESLSITG